MKIKKSDLEALSLFVFIFYFLLMVVLADKHIVISGIMMIIFTIGGSFYATHNRNSSKSLWLKRTLFLSCFILLFVLGIISLVYLLADRGLIGMMISVVSFILAFLVGGYGIVKYGV